jgi:prepilin-type N-terminal cleavage/methylation domain-containing protein
VEAGSRAFYEAVIEEKMMSKRKGFTLMELLVVIAVISLLMAILTPVVQRVRRNAKESVCQSNLRQWGMVFKMYTDEFDGNLIRNNDELAWYYPIREYYGNTADLLLCPSAVKPSNPYGSGAEPLYGGSLLAWGYLLPRGNKPGWGGYGSYGLNHWAYMYNKELGDGCSAFSYSYSYSYFTDANGITSSSSSFSSSNSSNTEASAPRVDARYWSNAYATNANNIPLVLDSWWLYANCNPDDRPPRRDAVPRVDVSEPANYVCMDRHSTGINSLFMDWSVRKVGLKELWRLKWHRRYNMAGPWTRAGGVRPENWPKWMSKCKDY